MGRAPVELAKRAKYKPPAMRVRDVGYTKRSPFRYKIRLFKPIYNERKGDFMANKANSLWDMILSRLLICCINTATIF